MKPIEFHWKVGTTSIVWEEPTCGIVRFHVPGDTDDHPKYRGVCFVKITGDTYEFKAMVMRDGKPATKAEHKSVKSYLESMGLRGISRRLKNGKVIIKNY